jgi:hypothetical protein
MMAALWMSLSVKPTLSDSRTPDEEEKEAIQEDFSGARGVPTPKSSAFSAGLGGNEGSNTALRDLD